MIKAICFDLDGVYFVNGKSNFIKNLHANYNISKEDAKAIFLKSDEMNKVYKEGKMTDEEFWSWAIEQWKITASPKDMMDLLIAGYEINPEVVETVKSVRQNGYKTLVCTNNFPARINGLQERFGFLDNFDGAAISYQVGATKPSRKIFETLVDETDAAAEEIVLADDNENNLAGAKEVGIQTFLYENFEQFKDKLVELGVNL